MLLTTIQEIKDWLYINYKLIKSIALLSFVFLITIGWSFGLFKYIFNKLFKKTIVKNSNKNKNKWWMSFPIIESRKILIKPFGPSPKFNVGNNVCFYQKPEKIRKILEIKWHKHRYQWVYIVETSAFNKNKSNNFKPYWFEDKLKLLK